MPMPPIQFFVTMFRDERDQARSQYVLLFLMEALSRVNASLIRGAEGRAKMLKSTTIDPAGMTGKIPEIYRSGVHYEREPSGQEHWPDMVNILALFDGPGDFPGPWGDCEDLACWRVAELRELHEHLEGGKMVPGGVKARPFAKWRRGSEGQFNYHALVMWPNGKIEDPSLVLGMRQEEAFARAGTAQKLKRGLIEPVIQFAEPPDVMVVDPDSPTGYKNRTDAKGLIGKKVQLISNKPDADLPEDSSNVFHPVEVPVVEREEAQAKVMEGTWDSYGDMDLEDWGVK